jgi:hypothetical protein
MPSLGRTAIGTPVNKRMLICVRCLVKMSSFQAAQITSIVLSRKTARIRVFRQMSIFSTWLVLTLGYEYGRVKNSLVQRTFKA